MHGDPSGHVLRGRRVQLDFPLNYNDVDFGFKVLEAGYRIIWTPEAELFHFESKSPEDDGRRLGICFAVPPLAAVHAGR